MAMGKKPPGGWQRKMWVATEILPRSQQCRLAASHLPPMAHWKRLRGTLKYFWTSRWPESPFYAPELHYYTISTVA